MTKFTIELEAEMKVPVGDTGLVTVLRIKDMPEATIRFAAINGLIGALNNVSRGKDENDKPNSDDVWASMREKRTRPWYEGSWGSVTRESASAPMREAYVDETRARTNQSIAEVEKDMAALVKSVFGDKEKATFGRFLDALANQVAKAQKLDEGETRDRLDAKYRRLAKEAADARAKAAEGLKLDFSAISLD